MEAARAAWLPDSFAELDPDDRAKWEAWLERKVDAWRRSSANGECLHDAEHGYAACEPLGPHEDAVRCPLCGAWGREASEADRGHGFAPPAPGPVVGPGYVWTRSLA